MLQKTKKWAAQHVILTSLHHFAAGFGIALLLQHYITGSAFAPMAAGMVLVGFSLIMHIYAWTR
jgi:hypothetical protein